MSLAIEDLKNFLDNSPTSWHAASQMGLRLALHDYTPLQESEKWSLEKGKKYFVSRNGSFCAFKLPSKEIEKCLIMAAHTDSPALKIKPNPEIVKDNMTLLATEVYGGPLLSSWLNRDLAIAGKVLVADKDGKIEEKLVMIDDAIVCIPQLAIHLDREVNEKGLVLNKQDHLRALVGIDLPKEKVLETLLRRSLSFHTLVSFDLFLVPIEPAKFIGASGELLASYRIDNLVSCHAAITALGNNTESPKFTLQMALFSDHEEIGSKTEEGAYSTFLEDVMTRIFASQKMNEEDRVIAKSKSLCLSMDMAHGFNPNYESKYEPSHRPLLGKGITIKYNADHKYATDGCGASFIVKHLHDLRLPYQNFTTRSDMGCGSTVGPITAHQMGIKTVDIGCPQLSMHSCREVLCSQDYIDLCVFLTHVLKNELS
ncbi:MAG: M18 family aminopeptidase [Chlamydiae bacterium]|nr:M18 family aminopeptidase [Chlamydiota bacterium]